MYWEISWREEGEKKWDRFHFNQYNTALAQYKEMWISGEYESLMFVTKIDDEIHKR